MGDDTWLDLGKPAADPKWGAARGRSWTAKMAYAPELRAAFLFGEGQHGWWNKQKRRYVDDLWAYDINAHRWICVYPGADVEHLDLRLNKDGVEVTPNVEPLPVAQMVHGYEGTCYDTDLHRFMFMPCSGGYWDAAMGERRMAWLKDKHAEVAKGCSPWMYDTQSGKWDRRAATDSAATGAPSGGYGDVLVYVPSQKRVFLRTAAIEVWWYDMAANKWSQVKQKGPPPPFGIDPTACYDTRRNRIYMGGGSYPVAKGPGAFWIYDVASDTWIDPKPSGNCCGDSNRYNSNIATMTYDQANDRVVINRHDAEPGTQEKGIWVYDPTSNAWEDRPRQFPAASEWKGQVNAFYDPDLNVHVYHYAGDSDDNGIIRLYRLGSPRQPH